MISINRLRFAIFSFLFLFLISLVTHAQNTVISGRVTDGEGNALENVSVQVKGTSIGTVTGSNGTYQLTVAKASGNVLVFSSVGFNNKEVAQSGSTVDVQLEKTNQSLDAVVVVGYGTQKRKDITGSVMSLDKQRLENMPNSNFAQALQGALPGVSISATAGGAEGNDVKIRIRGDKSITANASPLIILDGIPYNGSISDINPNDISNAEILKDASATAIYGSRATAGVILITTKKGSAGKPVFSYDGFTGFQQLTNLPELLSPEGFYQFKKTRNAAKITPSEQAAYDSKNFTDWLDLATQTGTKSQHNISVRGGATNFKYFASLSYLNVEGVAVNDKFKRLSSRVNLEANLTNWLTYGTNTQLSYNKRDGLPATFSGDYGAYFFNPLTKAYDANGNLTIYPWDEDKFFANPLAPTLAKNSDDNYKIFTTNYLQVKIPFVPGLGYRLNTGIEYQTRNINTYYGRDTRKGVQVAGDFSSTKSTARNFTLENILTYDRSFKKHTIGFTGLYSYEENNLFTNGLDAQGFPSDVLTHYQANVASLIKPSADFVKRSLISQMGRLNYGYDSRYLLTITGRRDGSSVFGANNKFAFFSSAALGWNISNEAFMQHVKTFSNLKLRISYGSNGNQGINPYQTLAELSTRSYVDSSATAAGYVPTRLSSPDLKWESTTSANIGLDFGVLNNRITGSIDVYDSKTNDLLLSRQISPVQGVTRVTQNIGKVDNKGVELNLNTSNIQKKDFNWSTNANLSLNRNKIVDLYGDGKSDTANTWFIGYPIDVTFDYIYNGVWQLKDDLGTSPQAGVKPGYVKVRDINGDGKITPDKDKVVQGRMEPRFIWGLGNTVKYKNLTLYVFVHGVQGVERPNTFLSDNNVQTDIRYNTSVKNWWTSTNPTNEYYANIEGANVYGAPILQDASFIRVKDISLSYDLSKNILEKAKLSRLKFYVEARNPFTITKWTGLDPELNSQQTIPLQREIIVGLNVSL